MIFILGLGPAHPAQIIRIEIWARRFFFERSKSTFTLCADE